MQSRTPYRPNDPMRFLDKQVGQNNEELLEMARIAVNSSPEPRYQIQIREQKVAMEEKERLGITFNKTFTTSLRNRMDELEQSRLEFLKDIVTMNDQISEDLKRYDEQLMTLVLTRITNLSLNSRIEQMGGLIMQLEFYKLVLEAKCEQFLPAKNFVCSCTDMMGFSRPSFLMDRYAALRHVYEELYHDYENRMTELNEEQDRLNELVESKTNENMELLNDMATMHLSLKRIMQKVSEYERLINEKIEHATGATLEMFKVKNAIYNTYSSIMAYRGFESTHTDSLDQLEQLEIRIRTTEKVVADFMAVQAKKAKYHSRAKVGADRKGDLRSVGGHGSDSDSDFDDTDNSNVRKFGSRARSRSSSVKFDTNYSHSGTKLGQEEGDGIKGGRQTSCYFGSLPPIEEHVVDDESQEQIVGVGHGDAAYEVSTSLANTSVLGKKLVLPSIKEDLENEAKKRERRLSAQLVKRIEMPKSDPPPSRDAMNAQKQMNRSANKSFQSQYRSFLGRRPGLRCASASAKSVNGQESTTAFPSSSPRRPVSRLSGTGSVSSNSGRVLTPRCRSEQGDRRFRTILRTSSPTSYHQDVNAQLMAFKTTDDINMNRLKRERLKRLLFGEDAKPFGSKFSLRSSFVEQWKRFGKFRAKHESLRQRPKPKPDLDLKRLTVRYEDKDHGSLNGSDFKNAKMNANLVEGTNTEWVESKEKENQVTPDSDEETSKISTFLHGRLPRTLIQSRYDKKIRAANKSLGNGEKKRLDDTVKDQDLPTSVFFTDPSKPRINIGYNQAKMKSSAGKFAIKLTETRSSVADQVETHPWKSLNAGDRITKEKKSDAGKGENASLFVPHFANRAKLKTDFLEILSRVKIRKELPE